MASEGGRELDSFLADWVTPHLRAAGFRKSHHTYRLRMPNGDQATVSFRGQWLGAFNMNVMATLEPHWDLLTYGSGKPYPDRADDGVTFWQQPGPPAGGHAWKYGTLAERDQVGHQMQDYLLDETVSTVSFLLDRRGVLDSVRTGPSDRFWGRRVQTLYRALLVDAGPSTELDQVIAAARQAGDSTFLDWSHARLTAGPVWQQLTIA